MPSLADHAATLIAAVSTEAEALCDLNMQLARAQTVPLSGDVQRALADAQNAVSTCKQRVKNALAGLRVAAISAERSRRIDCLAPR